MEQTKTGKLKCPHCGHILEFIDYVYDGSLALKFRCPKCYLHLSLFYSNSFMASLLLKQLGYGIKEKKKKEGE